MTNKQTPSYESKQAAKAKKVAEKDKEINSKARGPEEMAFHEPKNTALTWLTFLIAITACLAWGVFYYQWSKSKSTTLETLEQTKQQLIEQSAFAQQLQNKINETTSKIKQHQLLVQSYINQVKKLANGTGLDKEQAILNEAANLLNVANLNLNWQHDIEGTKQLVNAVQQRFQLLDDPQFAPLQQLIAKLQAELQNVANLDRVGMVNKLNSLSNLLPELRFSNQGSIIATQQSTPSTVKGALNKTLDMLSNVVSVRRYDPAAAPVYTAEQQRLINQQIKSMIQRAQWGLLHADNNLYQQSLREASRSIETHFNIKQSTTRQVVDSLETMAKINIAPTLPAIGTTISTVEKAIKEYQQHKTITLPVPATSLER